MNLTLRKGASFHWTLRPETSVQKYIPITAITMTEEGVQIIAPNHGIVDVWRCRISRCEGLTRLNTVDEDSPQPSDFLQAKAIDVDTVEINSRNTAGDDPYTGGGILQYGVPMDLTGCIVRAQIRPSEGSSIVTLDLAPYITVNASNFRINFDVSGSVTSLLAGNSGVLGVEIEDSAPDPFILSLAVKPVIFLREIVRDE